MNSIQLLIKIEEIKKQLQPNDTLEVTGIFSFKFTERGEILVRQLPFLARNHTAESLVAGGVKAVYLASGRMRVYAAKPGDENTNSRLLYLLDALYQTKQAQPKTEAVKHSASATPVHSANVASVHSANVASVVVAPSQTDLLEPEPVNSLGEPTVVSIESQEEEVKTEEQELAEIPF